MGTWTPAIFLGVGAFLINVVLGRLVRTQREQLATLKAFGYSNILLARHVLLMAFSVCLAAAILGIAAGAALGVYLTTFYIEVFRFPLLSFSLEPASVTVGIAVAAASSVLGVLGALRVLTRLSPAEAMRPEAPKEYRTTILERFGVRYVPIRWRMAVRAMENRPWRSLFAALGVGMSAAVLVVSSFALDSIEHIIEREYAAGHRYDIAVTFNEPVSASGIHSFAECSKASVAERRPIRTAAAKISNLQITRTVAIVGLDPDSELLRLLNKQGLPVELPGMGC